VISIIRAWNRVSVDLSESIRLALTPSESSNNKRTTICRMKLLLLIPRFGSLFEEYPVLVQIGSRNLMKFSSVDLAISVKETFNVRDVVLRKSRA
jgi:hypothetical protein